MDQQPTENAGRDASNDSAFLARKLEILELELKNPATF